MAVLDQPTLSTNRNDPKPDFVVVFDTSVATTTESEQPPSKAEAAKQLQNEYEQLSGLLTDAKLDFTSRNGGKGKILIFVRASEARVQAEIHRERLADWLHGVASTRPSPRTPRDFSANPVSPAERLRLVHSVLTHPRTATSTSITSSASSGRTAGLSPLPSPAGFPHITSIFPPHDPAFNRKWLENWSSRSHVLSIPPEELEDIRQHMGERVALYFAFLAYYFRSLAWPAGLGAVFWLAGLSYSPVYAALIVGWSVFFIERWRIKEKELAVQWGSYGVHNVEVQRSEFEGLRKVVDPVTGVEKEYFPFARTLGRQLSTMPIMLLYMGLLAAIISCIYSIETIVQEVYEGPGKRYLTLVPTVLFVGLVPQVIKLWDATARKLTAWENHEVSSQHANSLTLKVFALNFFVAYGSLLLTSYVYIPFGSILIPHILSLLPSKHAAKISSTSPGKLDFSINSSKLHTQIVAYTLTNQIVGAFTEIGVPFLMRLATKEVEKVQEMREKRKSGTASPTPSEQDDESERSFLERMRLEASLPVYTVFADYSEMTLQFGYMVLFSLIWPIAPVWSFVNNFFELRSDAFKITTQHQRPVPYREASIGPWLEVLGFISWLAALTNSSLVALYRPHMSHPSPTAEYLSELTSRNITLPANGTVYQTSAMHLASHSSTPISAIKSTLWTALLVALATEHAYLIFRGIVRFLLHRMVWKDSKAEQQIRRGQLEMRRGYLEEMNMKKGPEELSELSGAKDEAESKEKARAVLEGEDSFWTRGDIGLEEIRRRGKTE